MRLNIDCIRDLLLCIEENTGYNQPAAFVDTDLVQEINGFLPPPEVQPYQGKLLGSYANREIMYHLKYCLNAGLIDTGGPLGGQQTLVLDLTPQGHELLGDIRHKTIFDKTKEIASTIGVKTLPAFCQIAASVTSEIIKAHLGLNIP